MTARDSKREAAQQAGEGKDAGQHPISQDGPRAVRQADRLHPVPGPAARAPARLPGPEPGRVLTESDTDASAVTTFTVFPGGGPLGRISTAWDGAGGIGGLFGQLFAPTVLRVIYAGELKRLDTCARPPFPVSPPHTVGGRSGRARAQRRWMFMPASQPDRRMEAGIARMPEQDGSRSLCAYGMSCAWVRQRICRQ